MFSFNSGISLKGTFQEPEVLSTSNPIDLDGNLLPTSLDLFDNKYQNSKLIVVGQNMNLSNLEGLESKIENPENIEIPVVKRKVIKSKSKFKRV